MADRINIARNNSVIIDPPSFEYTGEVCIPKVTVIVNDIVLTESVDYTIEFGEKHIDAGTVPITITGTNNYIGIIRKSYRITPISIVNAEWKWADDTITYTYTGQAFEPAFTISQNGHELKRGVDYSSEYTDNTDAGVASVFAKGIGNYGDGLLAEFFIEPRDIAETNYTFTGDFIYSGGAVVPEINITYNDMTLQLYRDYEYEVFSNTESGNAILNLYGKENYTGVIEYNYIIEKAQIKNAQFVIETLPVYTGEEIIPTWTVSYNGLELQQDKDYKIISTKNNINANNTKAAEIEVEGLGNFTGTHIIKFDILPRPISEDDEDFNYVYDKEVEYNGLTLEPEVTITYKGKNLVQGTDYTLVYNNNINATGDKLAEIVVTGKGNFKDTITLYFTILPSSVSITMVLNSYEWIYTGFKIEPEVSIYLKGELLKDYSLAYENNVDVTAEAKVTATLTGNYRGSISANYSILQANLEQCTVELSQPNYYFNNSDIKAKLKITLGKYVLQEDKDYEIIDYENNFNVGQQAKVIYKSLNQNFSESVELEKIFTILPRDAKDCTIQIKYYSAVYTGEEIKPDIDVYLNDNIVDTINYDITYSNNINASSNAIILITGKNNLINQKSKTFTIGPIVLTKDNCVITAELLEDNQDKDLYNISTVKVWYLGKDLIEGEDYTLTYFTEENLTEMVVETTVTALGKSNYAGSIFESFWTGYLAEGEIDDLLSQIDRKPGYTYINYTNSMEGLFRVSSQGKSAIDELNTQLYNHGYCNESVSLTTIPIYYLQPNTTIHIQDHNTKINGDYIISKIDIPLGNGGTMSITATKAAKRIY